MIGFFKRRLYFPIASYFKFWAQIRLKLWHPRIIVVTGSSGKTTLLHLIESQLGSQAKYSHHANSSFGIPFDILGLHRRTLLVFEWPLLFITAPFKVAAPLPKQKLYVIEVDCDRPHEGRFLATFLNPEVTLWVSVSKTHSMNFDHLITRGQFGTIEEAVAHEFASLSKFTTKLVIANGDSEFISAAVANSSAPVKFVHLKPALQAYSVSKTGTDFKINDRSFHFPYLLPQETVYQLLMCTELVNYLGFPLEVTFSKFQLPPGRSSIFSGIKNTTFIESTYNANLESMSAILYMYAQFPGRPKWAVLGDMIELGHETEGEHQLLAAQIIAAQCDRVILMGPRLQQYTYPILKRQLPQKFPLVSFLNPPQVLSYLESEIVSGETILFKGARFLEGVIAKLLENPRDADRLPRREKIWHLRRKKWGL